MLNPSKIQALDAISGFKTPSTSSVDTAVSSRADEIRQIADQAMKNRSPLDYNPATEGALKADTEISDVKQIPKEIGKMGVNLVTTPVRIAGTIKDAVNEGIELSKETPKNPQLLPGFSTLGQFSEGLADTTGKMLKPFALLGSHVSGAISNAVKSITGYSLDPESEAILQKTANAINDPHKGPLGISQTVWEKAAEKSAGLQRFIIENPEQIPVILESANASLTKMTGAPVDVVSTIAKPVTKTAQIIGDVASSVTKPVKNAVSNYVENSLKNEWIKPAETPKAGFRRPNEIFDKAADQGHDIPDTLIKSKIRLSDNVENGTYNTIDTADNMRADTGKLSSEMLRPALEKADATGIPKTPVKSVIGRAIYEVSNNKFLTAEEKASLITKLQESEVALKGQYKDGMSLTDMHDEKILRGTKTKRSPIGDVDSNLEAQKNEALRDALMSKVEEVAPPEIPVAEFNAELRKAYQAADYLDSLHGKKVPVSIGSRIAKTTAKVIGAGAGTAMGGGIMGGVGGYHIGGLIETLLEGIPNPVKGYFLDNLKTVNPEAFMKVQDYLKSFETKGSVAQPTSKTSMNTSKDIPKGLSRKDGLSNTQGGFVRIMGEAGDKLAKLQESATREIGELSKKANADGNIDLANSLDAYSDQIKASDAPRAINDYLQEARDKVKVKNDFSSFHADDQKFLSEFAMKVKTRKPVSQADFKIAQDTWEAEGFTVPKTKQELADLIETAEMSSFDKGLNK